MSGLPVLRIAVAATLATLAVAWADDLPPLPEPPDQCSSWGCIKACHSSTPCTNCTCRGTAIVPLPEANTTATIEAPTGVAPSDVQVLLFDDEGAPIRVTDARLDAGGTRIRIAARQPFRFVVVGSPDLGAYASPVIDDFASMTWGRMKALYH